MPEFPLFDLITCHEHLPYEFTQIVLKSVFIQCIFLWKIHTVHSKGFPGGASDKASACNAGDTREAGSIPGQEDPLEKEMATHSSILAWKIPCTEKPGRKDFFFFLFLNPQWSRKTPYSLNFCFGIWCSIQVVDKLINLLKPCFLMLNGGSKGGTREDSVR